MTYNTVCDNLSEAISRIKDAQSLAEHMKSVLKQRGEEIEELNAQIINLQDEIK